MSNFKSGSGNLDFGENEEGDEEDDGSSAESTGANAENEDEPQATSSDRPGTASPGSSSTETERGSDHPASRKESTDESAGASASATEYPYFVRRSNVGDERDTRLEIHVRDKVADQEAGFRSDLADFLDANEVSKTDAREFALLAAYQHPEQVAALMQDEGFGTLD